MSLKEKIAQKLYEFAEPSWKLSCHLWVALSEEGKEEYHEQADQILNLIIEAIKEIELSDEEILEHANEEVVKHATSLERNIILAGARVIAEAQKEAMRDG